MARLLRKSPVGLLSVLVLFLLVLATVFASVIAPRDPQATAVTTRFIPPSPEYTFGTDNLGRDVLMLSFPSVLLAILIVATIGRGLSNLIIAIAFAMVPVFARLVRSVVLSLLYEEYVTAARSLGARGGHIIRHHILPNIIAPIIVQASGLLAVAISTAAALNFIGLGVQPPDPDWGLMVADGQKMLYDAPHVPLYPGLAITLTVLSINFVGDMLRDVLDPKLRRSG